MIEEEEEYYASLASSQISNMENLAEEVKEKPSDNSIVQLETSDGAKSLELQDNYLNKTQNKPEIVSSEKISSSRHPSRKALEPKRNDSQPKFYTLS